MWRRRRRARPSTSDGRPSAARRAARLACAAALMATCAVNFVAAPACMCLMDGRCTAAGGHDGSFASYGAYPRAIAVACFASYAAVLRGRAGAAAAAYRRAVAACELYAPATAAERRRCAAFGAACAAACAAATVPVNALRVYLLHARRAHPAVVAFVVAMYAQNAGMCLLETRFVALCYALRARFGRVNRDLERLLSAERGTGGRAYDDDGDGGGGGGPARRVTYDGDFYGSSARRRGRRDAAANAVEIMRVRHRLARDAVRALVDLFGVPMGMSLSALGVVSLFDIYYEVFAVAGADTRWPAFVYMWMVQYSVRFFAIVATAHQMTKQALKSKVLIADMNNRYLDDDTKEELQIFFSQISSSSIEFTACDLFTLNMHLITSAIAAGSTFLVILLQLDL